MAKIGSNKDPNVDGKYIGFAYGKSEDKELLISWAQKFQFAELIDELDEDGVSTPESKTYSIK